MKDSNPVPSDPQNPLADALKNFQFDVAWEKGGLPSDGVEAHGSSRTGHRTGFRQDDRSRRPGGDYRRPERSDSGERSDRRDRFDRPSMHQERSYDRSSFERPAFAPVEALFQPEAAPFKALVQAMKASKRAYDLIELAQMVLEKPERFVVSLRHLAKEGQAAPLLYVSPADNLPFLTEEDAIQHSLKNIDAFFTIESIEAEPPKGNFAFVYECPKTGALLTPPNYHKAQELLRSHHMAHGNGHSFDSFQSSLKKNNDPEKVQAWIQQMSQKTVYKSKVSGDEAAVFDTLVAAHNYLLTHFKNKLAKPAKQVYISGQNLEKLPHSLLKSTLERFWQIQKRNSFSTVNYIRMRLKQLGFSAFKRSGQTYVCSVKRRLRTVGMEFSAAIAGLIAFLEQNPSILVSELAEKYLEIPAATPEAPHSAEQDQKIKSLMQDLYWLIREGYLTEFNNGHLFLSPFETPVSEKKALAKDAKDAQDESITNESPEDESSENESSEELIAFPESVSEELPELDPLEEEVVPEAMPSEGDEDKSQEA